MKRSIILCLCLTGCGFASRSNTLSGQVKKLVHETPLLCEDYTNVDVSLGVMRNGVGSVSKEDMWLTVASRDDAKLLEGAAKSGQIVDITYDVKRFNWCWKEREVTSVTVEQ